MKCKRLLIEPGCWNASFANFHSLPKRLRGETIVDTHKNSETTTDHNCGNLLSLLELPAALLSQMEFLLFFLFSLLARLRYIIWILFFRSIGGRGKKRASKPHTTMSSTSHIPKRLFFLFKRVRICSEIFLHIFLFYFGRRRRRAVCVQKTHKKTRLITFLVTYFRRRLERNIIRISFYWPLIYDEAPGCAMSEKNSAYKTTTTRDNMWMGRGEKERWRHNVSPCAIVVRCFSHFVDSFFGRGGSVGRWRLITLLCALNNVIKSHRCCCSSLRIFLQSQKTSGRCEGMAELARDRLKLDNCGSSLHTLAHRAISDAHLESPDYCLTRS